MDKDRENDGLYSLIPENFPAGTRYTTPDRLAKSELTSYSYTNIMTLFNKGKLPGAAKIGNQVILGEEAVEAIIDRDQKRASGELKLGGPKPGTPSPKRGRRRLTQQPRFTD